VPAVTDAGPSTGRISPTEHNATPGPSRERYGSAPKLER
jgi:hypothetical protein